MCRWLHVQVAYVQVAYVQVAYVQVAWCMLHVAFMGGLVGNSKHAW